MSQNPAVVIAHGFYHTPAPYQALIEAFNRRGIDAYCPQLPTSNLHCLNVGDVNNPDFDLEPPAGGYPQGKEDTDALLAVLKPLIDEGKPVLLLAHSAGGWVVTQAAVSDLQAKTRQAKGLDGGIIGILYYGAFVIPVNESIHSFFQPKDGTLHTPSWLQFHVSKIRVLQNNMLNVWIRNMVETG
jgi:pimeloyl-ACP methyl ester carboxylesterase